MYTSIIYKIKQTFSSPIANFHLYLFDPPVLVCLVETEGGVEDPLQVGRAVTRLALLAGAWREADRLGRHGASQPAGGGPGPPHLQRGCRGGPRQGGGAGPRAGPATRPAVGDKRESVTTSALWTSQFLTL